MHSTELLAKKLPGKSAAAVSGFNQEDNNISILRLCYAQFPLLSIFTWRRTAAA
jgi:hypothetical protein